MFSIHKLNKDIVKRYPLAYLDREIGVEPLHQHSQPEVLAVADYERTGQGQHRDLGRGLSRWRSSHPVSFQADEGDGRRGAVSRFNWPGSRFQVVSETQPFSSSVLPPTTLGLNSLISLQHQNQTGLTTRQSSPSSINSKIFERLERSRHCSPINFLVNFIAGLIAYCHQPKKQSLGLQSIAL